MITRASKRRGGRVSEPNFTAFSTSHETSSHSRVRASRPRARKARTTSEVHDEGRETSRVGKGKAPATVSAVDAPFILSLGGSGSSEELTEEQMLANLFACAAEASEHGSDSDEEEKEDHDLEYGRYARSRTELSVPGINGVQSSTSARASSPDVHTPNYDQFAIGHSHPVPNVATEGSAEHTDPGLPVIQPSETSEEYERSPSFDAPVGSGPASQYQISEVHSNHAHFHPSLHPLSHPHIPRPYTDRDGWTSTGILNYWGEEIIELDGNTWAVVPSATAVKYPPDLRGPGRRYKSYSQIDDDHVFGFPPPAGRKNLPKDPKPRSKWEDVNLEYHLMCVRQAAAKRGLKVDRNMQLIEIEDLITTHDDTYGRPETDVLPNSSALPQTIFQRDDTAPALQSSASESSAPQPAVPRSVTHRQGQPEAPRKPDPPSISNPTRRAPPPRLRSVLEGISTIDFMKEEQLERQRMRQIDAPDLNFSHLAKAKGPLLSQNHGMNGPPSAKIPTSVSFLNLSTHRDVLHIFLTPVSGFRQAPLNPHFARQWPQPTQVSISPAPRSPSCKEASSCRKRRSDGSRRSAHLRLERFCHRRRVQLAGPRREAAAWSRSEFQGDQPHPSAAWRGESTAPGLQAWREDYEVQLEKLLVGIPAVENGRTQ